jgi:hypothetical protein
VHDIAAVYFYGLAADAQMHGDLLGAPAFGDELQHFPFAGRQRGNRRGAAGGSAADAFLYDDIGHPRADVFAADHHRMDGFHHLVEGPVFQQIAGCPGAERLNEKTPVGVHRENDDLHGIILRQDLPRRIDAVQERHRDIHHDDIDGLLTRRMHRFTAVIHFGDYLHIRFLVYQHPEPLPEYLVIIGDHDAYLRLFQHIVPPHRFPC